MKAPYAPVLPSSNTTLRWIRPLCGIALAMLASLTIMSAALPPMLDLADDTSRQVVIARGDAQTYQGHPTTVLLPDGRTMFCVWSYDHGGVCGPMKRSDDGGLTWSELLPVPENWSTVRNCPAIYRLIDPKGVPRLFVFGGQGPDGLMHQAVSEDDGRTWSPMRSNGLICVMPFCTIVPIEGGKRLLGMTNIRRPGETVEYRSNVLAQSISDDGGFTWSPWRVVADDSALKLSEPYIVRSPDGRQLLALIRENSRTHGALFMTSDDDGGTWTKPRLTPAGLYGDRHMATYAADGRLVVCFRDVGKESPTYSHFVAWVGRYEDIVDGRPGQYRLKLLHSFKGLDCGYPGLERLADGTMVATTYIKYREGPEKNSVVSARFRLSETDRLIQAVRQAGTGAEQKVVFRESTVWTRGEDGIPSHFVYGLSRTTKNTLLAFTEARLHPRDDAPHHLVLKRSQDLGVTWSDDIMIERADGTYWKQLGISDRLECWTNPAALVDRHTGRAFIFYALNEGIVREKFNTQRFTRNFYRTSDDDGVTWSDRIEITELLNTKADGTANRTSAGEWIKDVNGFPCDFLGRAFHMPGPGHGLQLQSGRLLLPFWNRVALGTLDGRAIPSAERRYGLRLIYSDDGGATWRTGPAIGHDLSYTESRIVEFSDGNLYLNARTSDAHPTRRGVLDGEPGGLVWKDRGLDEAMPPYTPVDSGLALVSHRGREILLLSHPREKDRRRVLTISASLDRGKTWALHKVVHEEGANYSDLVSLPDGTVGLLYARGPSAHDGFDVRFIRFSPAWLGL